MSESEPKRLAWSLRRQIDRQRRHQPVETVDLMDYEPKHRAPGPADPPVSDIEES